MRWMMTKTFLDRIMVKLYRRSTSFASMTACTPMNFVQRALPCKVSVYLHRTASTSNIANTASSGLRYYKLHCVFRDNNSHCSGWVSIRLSSLAIQRTTDVTIHFQNKTCRHFLLLTWRPVSNGAVLLTNTKDSILNALEIELLLL